MTKRSCFGRPHIPIGVSLLGRGGVGIATVIATGSELARQLVRDPYVFDHLALSERVAARELLDVAPPVPADERPAPVERCGASPEDEWCPREPHRVHYHDHH